MQSWADDPNFEYHRFNVQSADTFIEEHFDARILAAYRKCGVPAMQSDFFRYCILYVYGGVYVDVATENGAALSPLLEKERRGILLQRVPKKILPNGFMYFRAKNDRLLSAVIDQAVLNIENRLSNNVWQVTGPGILSQMYFWEGRDHLFNEISIFSIFEFRKYCRFISGLEYKHSKSDWRVSIKDNASIYLDV